MRKLRQRGNLPFALVQAHLSRGIEIFGFRSTGVKSLETKQGTLIGSNRGNMS